MQDWSKYIEQNYKKDALPGLLAEGYQVVEDELGIYDYRNILLKKDDIKIQLVCVPEDMDDFEEKERSEEVFSLDDSEWIVEDVFENGESCFENE